MDGTWQFNDGDMSIAASSEAADQSMIREDIDDVHSFQLTNASPSFSDDGNNSDAANNNGITAEKCSEDSFSGLNCTASQTQISCDGGTRLVTKHASASPASCNGTGSKSQHPAVVTPSRLLVFAWAVVFAVLFVCSALAVFAFVILEVDTDVALIGNIQRLPEVCAFRQEQYMPWRNWFLPAVLDESKNRWRC